MTGFVRRCAAINGRNEFMRNSDKLNNTEAKRVIRFPAISSESRRGERSMSPVALSVMRYAPFFKRKNALKVLDYGAGKLRNALYLTEAGFHVFAADTPEQVRRIRELDAVNRLDGLLDNQQLRLGGLNADLVVSTYVFNIIPDDDEKFQYIRNASINLRPQGYLLIEVQCRRESPQCGSGCSSHMKCPSCAKACSLEELDGIVNPFGFKRLCHYYRRHALAVVYQLQNGQIMS